ncbi:TetR/AcrR family transcriptional regulator [Arthrobacter sp. NPDC056493]|uniref:TetR/AcrR family transcriptional regulator n=1 Tax=Arthrobacter sp. NPDC056493 TaxID=3345839 RepID=UPI0036725293
MSETSLRKDAEDNRRRLLVAAREVFAEHGFEATLHDVARHAGVGVGTAYRRFSNKYDLMDAILEDQVNELEQVLRDSLAEPDAWAGIVSYLERSLAIQARDRGMAQILSGKRITKEQYDWERDRLAPLVTALADRAREQRVVRPDLTGTDLIFLQIGIAAIAFTARAGAANVDRGDVTDLYRRYLWIALDGIRARAGAVDLPVEALSTEQTHQLLGQRPIG